MKMKIIKMMLVTRPRWPPCLFMVKPLQNLFQNQQADFHETWYVASGTFPTIVCSNDDPGVTLTYFMASSKFETWAFLKEKGKTVDISETIAASGLQPTISVNESE